MTRKSLASKVNLARIYSIHIFKFSVVLLNNKISAKGKIFHVTGLSLNDQIA
jgi:hypothetical protein